MDSTQWAAVLKYVFHRRGKWRKLLCVAYDAHVRRDRLSKIQHALQQRPAAQCHERLVRPHARALAPGKDEGGHRDQVAVHGAMIHGLIHSRTCDRSLQQPIEELLVFPGFAARLEARPFQSGAGQAISSRTRSKATDRSVRPTRLTPTGCAVTPTL